MCSRQYNIDSEKQQRKVCAKGLQRMAIGLHMAPFSPCMSTCVLARYSSPVYRLTTTVTPSNRKTSTYYPTHPNLRYQSKLRDPIDTRRTEKKIAANGNGPLPTQVQLFLANTSIVRGQSLTSNTGVFVTKRPLTLDTMRFQQRECGTRRIALC